MVATLVGLQLDQADRLSAHHRQSEAVRESEARHRQILDSVQLSHILRKAARLSGMQGHSNGDRRARISPCTKRLVYLF